MITYYDDELISGIAYQEHVTKFLNEHAGMNIKNYETKEEQYNIGENDAGIEIKFDKKFSITRRFWIETQERTSRFTSYVPSGIFRCDNSTDYLIGDYNTAFLFDKKVLQNISGDFEEEENHKFTSKAFFLPISKAKEIVKMIYKLK